MSLLSLLGGASGSPITTTPAQGVDLDGTYDYFSRSTDLTGNVDSKTFTFSAWVYFSSRSNSPYIIRLNSSFAIQINTTGSIYITGKNSSATTILNVTTSTGKIQDNTFCNIIISCDLSDTNSRSIYINDTFLSMSGGTFTNDTLDFTGSTHLIGYGAGAGYVKGRLSNVFLDYTYRDLSIEANRRLFIDANGKPADGWKALSPIIGMSMADAATAHINDYGTGGNFTPNGTYATSNRGANQDNCVASYFDGVADYLSRTSLTGIADGKQFTFSCTLGKYNNTSGYAIGFGSAGGVKFAVLLIGLDIYLQARNSANVLILSGICTGKAIANTTFTITISVDLTNQSASKVLKNNINITPTWATFTNDTINFIGTTTFQIGAQAASSYLPSNIGELYFNTTYIDLATSNPFWDSVENKPIPVRKVIADTGVTPIIAMPLDASNAGKNYGTGGDFTPNSAPYVGARGASEFWARSAKFDGTTGYLSRGALTGAVDSKTLSFVSYFNPASTSIVSRIIGLSNGTSVNLLIYLNTDNKLYIVAKNSAGTIIVSGSTDSTVATIGLARIVEYSLDTTNQSASLLYLNGFNYPITYTVFTNDFVDITVTTVDIGAIYNGTHNGFFNGTQAICYFTTGYIDFSQEVNQLKLVDGLGYPLDLSKQIASGAIPNPLIYLPFDDTTNLGKNLGTGGDFTVNGTVTAGSDVN